MFSRINFCFHDDESQSICIIDTKDIKQGPYDVARQP